MVRGLLNKLVSRSLSVAGKWQQQQLRRLNIHEYQGAELMNKYGINVPKGIAVSSVDEAKKAVQTAFPDAKELVVKSQILAGGRGLGTFKSGLKGGVHILKVDQVEEFAGKMLGQILVTKQTGPQGKVVSKIKEVYAWELPGRGILPLSLRDSGGLLSKQRSYGIRSVVNIIRNLGVVILLTVATAVAGFCGTLRNVNCFLSQLLPTRAAMITQLYHRKILGLLKILFVPCS